MKNLFLSVLLIPFITHGKQNPCFQSDSTALVVFDHVSKEMILPGQTPYQNELGRSVISLLDAQKSINFFCDKSKLKGRIALLTHYNIYITYFANGDQIAELRLSSFTRNINFDTPNGDFSAGLTNKTERFVKKILEKYKLLQLIPEEMCFP